MVPRILIIPGSVRSGSYNVALSAAAAKELAEQGAEVTRISLVDYPLAIMDEDLEAEKGIPENAVKLGRQIAAHDGVLIVSPEYNGSIPPLLKNAIDWVSRISPDKAGMPNPWKGRPAAIAAASNGRLGGVRVLNHLRPVLMNVGCEVVTAQVGVFNAAKAFDDKGMLLPENGRALLAAACSSLIELCRALRCR